MLFDFIPTAATVCFIAVIRIQHLLGKCKGIFNRIQEMLKNPFGENKNFFMEMS